MGDLGPLVGGNGASAGGEVGVGGDGVSPLGECMIGGVPDLVASAGVVGDWILGLTRLAAECSASDETSVYCIMPAPANLCGAVEKSIVWSNDSHV